MKVSPTVIAPTKEALTKTLSADCELVLCHSERFALQLREMNPRLRVATELSGLVSLARDSDKMVSKLERELLMSLALASIPSEELSILFPHGAGGADRSLALLYEELSLLGGDAREISERLHETYATEAARWGSIAHCFERYEELLAERNLTDFRFLREFRPTRVALCGLAQLRPWSKRVLENIPIVQILSFANSSNEFQFGPTGELVQASPRIVPHRVTYVSHPREYRSIASPPFLFSSDEEARYLSQLDGVESRPAFPAFLDAVQRAARTRRIHDLATLARFSPIERTLRTQCEGDPLVHLDTYQKEKLQLTFDRPLVGTGHGKALLEFLKETYIRPLSGSYSSLLDALSHWCSGWEGEETIREILEGLRTLRIVPEENCLARIRTQFQPERERQMRFADLPLLFEDHPPTLLSPDENALATTKSGFLNDGIRKLIGVQNARDETLLQGRYLLHLFHACHPEARIVVSQTDLLGELRLPCSLLLPTTGVELANELNRAFATSPPTAERRTPEDIIFIPSPQRRRERNRFSVTELDRFRETPFKYFLETELELLSLNDHVHELDGAQFGSLAHDILARFGADPNLSVESDPEQIATALITDLREEFDRRFGRNLSAAIVAQRLHLENRFRAFATLQSSLREDGWEIVSVETPLPERTLRVGERDVTLYGRADRIDRRGEALRIFDYKFLESGDPGIERDGSFKKLQLSLYAWLHGLVGETEVAYVTLGAERADLTTLRISEFELQLTLEETTTLLEKLLAGDFTPTEEELRKVRAPFAHFYHQVVPEEGDDE